MSVAISLLTLVPGRMGGSETYARQLVRALARLESFEGRVFVSPAARDAGGGLPTTVVEVGAVGGSSLGRAAGLALGTLRGGALRRQFAGSESVHYPLTVPYPRLPGVPSAVTLHDVQHLDQPEHFGRATRLYRAVAYDRAARDADAVVVPSRFVAERARAHLGLRAERVRVVPEGVDSSLFAPGDALREPFLLYPARPWPHKNHARLFRAFALLRRRRPELRLVLTGGGTERLTLPERVEARGFVPEHELVSLYQRTLCTVFPSLYEGFGLPVLEALACASPVASSRAGALPEVGGDAVVLFDGEDPEAIARGVEEAIERRDELAGAGPARAARFSWDACARAHADVYRSLG